MKRMMANVLVLLAAATLAGLGVATATVGTGSGAETAATSTASGARYEYPADVQAARKACFRAEREARGIPGTDAAYRVWFEDNRGNAAWLDWRTAYQACKDANEVAGAKWSAEWYGNLVRVR